jgi:hypothetical protein
MINDYQSYYYGSRSYNWVNLPEKFSTELLYKLKRLRIILLKPNLTKGIKKQKKEIIYEELYEDFIFYYYREPIPLEIQEFLELIEIRKNTSKKLMGDEFDEEFFEKIKENLIQKHYGDYVLKDYRFKKLEQIILEYKRVLNPSPYNKQKEQINKELKPQILPLDEKLREQIDLLYKDIENIKIDRFEIAKTIIPLIDEHKKLTDELIVQSKKINLTEFMVDYSKKTTETLDIQKKTILKRIESNDESFFTLKNTTKQQFIEDIKKEFDLLIELKKEHAYLDAKDSKEYREDIHRINSEIRRIERKVNEFIEHFYLNLPNSFPLLLLFNTISSSVDEIGLEPTIIDGNYALRIQFMDKSRIEINSITIKDLTNSNLLAWSLEKIGINVDDFIKMIKSKKNEPFSVEITSKPSHLHFNLTRTGFPTIHRTLALLDLDFEENPIDILKRLSFQNYIKLDKKTLNTIFKELKPQGDLIEFKTEHDRIKIITNYNYKENKLPKIEIPFSDLLEYELNDDFDITFSFLFFKKFQPTTQKILNLLQKDDSITLYFSYQRHLTFIGQISLNNILEKEEDIKKYLGLLNLEDIDLKNEESLELIKNTYFLFNSTIYVFYHLNSKNEIIISETSLKYWWDGLKKHQRNLFLFVFDKKSKVIESNWESLKEKNQELIIDYLKEFIWAFSTYLYLDDINGIEFTTLPLKIEFELFLTKNMPISYEYYLAPRIEDRWLDDDDDDESGKFIGKEEHYYSKFRMLNRIFSTIENYKQSKNSILSLETDFNYSLPSKIKKLFKTIDKRINKEYKEFEALSDIEGMGEKIAFSNKYADLELDHFEKTLTIILEDFLVSDFETIIYYNRIISTLLTLEIPEIVEVEVDLTSIIQKIIDLSSKKKDYTQFSELITSFEKILVETLDVNHRVWNKYILYLMLKDYLNEKTEFKKNFKKLENEFDSLKKYELEKIKEGKPSYRDDIVDGHIVTIDRGIEHILMKNEELLENYNFTLKDFGFKKKKAGDEF